MSRRIPIFGLRVLFNRHEHFLVINRPGKWLVYFGLPHFTFVR